MTYAAMGLLFGTIGMFGMVSACGTVVNLADEKHDAAPAAITPPPVVTSEPVVPKDFEGFVGGAFEVTVDGVVYADMEDFYTQEQARLPAKVKQAGYDESWTVRFDAQIGFSDLWRNMTVYLSPVDKFGYQGETRVEDSGHFAITVPASGLNHDYKARANKRIGIMLARGETQRKICYNFSALEKNVPFAGDSMPIVLDAFVSTVTAYDCNNVNSNGGVNVPAADGKPETLRTGLTKSDATRILGLKGLSVESPVSWCWAYRPSLDSPCTEARPVADGAAACDCRITFSNDGVVTKLEGFAKAYTGAL